MVSGRLAGKIAIVTGAAQGIGAAVALRFASEGAQVVVADLSGTAPAAAGISAWRTDITLPAELAALTEHTLSRYGRIDILVNNAGQNFFHEPLKVDDAEWDRCLSVDLKGTWNACKAVLPSMLAQGAGAIVNVASVHGHKIIPSTFPYPVAKHGLIGLTRALGVEYAPRGVRVNSVSPGLILTPSIEAWLAACPQAERLRQVDLLPIKRIGRVEDVAAAVLFLASDEAGFITGADLLVDGGRSQIYHDAP